jgi:hypothetical protein
MSPRAVWRLEAAGFGPVYGYAAGKTDWLAAELGFEGRSGTRIGESGRRRSAGGLSPDSGDAVSPTGA